jgi:hypothetical protein
MAAILSFVVGVLSSLVATFIAFLRGKARFRLRLRAIVALIVNVAKQLELDNFSPQYIVTIDRNSGVVGSILAGHIGRKHSAPLGHVPGPDPPCRSVPGGPVTAGASPVRGRPASTAGATSFSSLGCGELSALGSGSR